jgi:hypothetical protein
MGKDPPVGCPGETGGKAVVYIRKVDRPSAVRPGKKGGLLPALNCR